MQFSVFGLPFSVKDLSSGRLSWLWKSHPWYNAYEKIRKITI
jgi:hypothetical protein